jgi:hypothetical protein
VFKTLCLTDHQNVLEMNLFGGRRGRRHLACRLLCFEVAAEKSQEKKEDDSEKTHACSLGLGKRTNFARQEVYWGLPGDAIHLRF